MSLAGLICGPGNAAVQHPAGIADDVIPLERGTRVRLVGLDMKVTEHALVTLEFVIRQLFRNRLAIGIARVVAVDLWKDFAKRGGQPRPGRLLFGREIVLDEFTPLHGSSYRLRLSRAADEAFGANAPVPQPRGNF